MLHFYTENLQQCNSCTVSRQASKYTSHSVCYCYEGERLSTQRMYCGILHRSVHNDIPVNVVVHMLVLLLCIWAAVGSVQGWISCSYASLHTYNSSDSKSTSWSLPLYSFPIQHSKSTSCLRPLKLCI